MKENSIEEDITLIEKSLCDKDTIIQYHYWVGTDFLNAVERIVADYKRVLKENEQLKNENKKLKYKIKGQECVIETQAHNEEVYESIFERLEKENKELKNALNVEQK